MIDRSFASAGVSRPMTRVIRGEIKVPEYVRLAEREAERLMEERHDRKRRAKKAASKNT